MLVAPNDKVQIEDTTGALSDMYFNDAIERLPDELIDTLVLGNFNLMSDNAAHFMKNELNDVPLLMSKISLDLVNAKQFAQKLLKLDPLLISSPIGKDVRELQS